MARSSKGSLKGTEKGISLASRDSRLGLRPRKAPYRVTLEPGIALGYYKPVNGGVGSWIAFLNPTKKGDVRPIWKQRALGAADDLVNGNGETILNWSQAQAKTREWTGGLVDDSARALAGDTVHVGPYTVAKAIQDYLDDAKRRGMKGHGRTENAAKVHITPELGALEVAKLTRGRIETWQAALAGAPRRLRTKPGEEQAFAAPPKSADEIRARRDTANRVLSILKAALNHALDRRRVKHGDAWKLVKPFRGTTSARVRFLSSVEQVRLVNACTDDFRLLVKAALYTGARYGELARLQAKDYNPEAGTVWIAPGKTDKGRHVAITEEAKVFFSELVVGMEPDAVLFTQSKIERRKRKDLNTPKGWAKSDQMRHMAAACKGAEIDRLTFHELRHTFASTWIAQGMALAFIADLLGHTDTRMVSKHYGHLAPNALADAVKKLDPKLGLHSPSGVETLKIAGA